MDRPSTAGRSRTTPLTTRARSRPKSAHLTSKDSTSSPKKQPHIGFTGYTDYTRNNDTNGNTITKSNPDGVDSTSIAGTIRFNFNDRPRPATASGPDASSRPTTSTGTTTTTTTITNNTTNNTSTRVVNGKSSGNGNGNTHGSAQVSPPSRQRSQGRPDAIQKGHTFVTSNFPTLVDQSNKGGGGGGGDERVPQTENKSVHLLRGLVSAETGLHKKSTMELLITAFLRTKSDIKVLRDFCSYCLTKPQEIESNFMKMSAQDLFAPNVTDSMRIVQILKMKEYRDKLIFDICSGLLIEKNVGMNEELEPIPETCTARLTSLLTFFGTFIDIAKEISMKRMGLDQDEERTVQSLEEKCKSLEQAYSTLKVDARALKAKYDNIMTEGGKHQGMARQQHTIDELELKVKNISKHIEDADNAKKMALKSELKLKDDVLRLEAQLEALKETYEGELGTLKPMVHEQVSYTSDNLKEIRDLKTNLLLGKERYAVLNNQFESAQNDLQTMKFSVSELARQLGHMTDRADKLEGENARLERVLKVTAAAKMSSDAVKHESESKIANLSAELNAAQAKMDEAFQANTKLVEDLKTSENNVGELRRQQDLLTVQYEAKCCEVVSIEGALQDQAIQVERLMKRIPVGGSQQGGVAPINFDMKKKPGILVERRKSNTTAIPDIAIGGDDDDVRTPRSRRSELLTQWSSNADDEQALEMRKKDHKIKKLEDKLKRSQMNLKDALDRVYQLEKVKIDEAAGAIPQRRTNF